MIFKNFYVSFFVLYLIKGKIFKLVQYSFIKFHMTYLILVAKLDEYEYKLINDLLRGYNLYARPSLHFEEPTNVTFGLSLSQLIDVVMRIPLKHFVYNHILI